MTIIFSDGFDSGNANNWSGSSGSLTFPTGIKHHGAYSLYTDGNRDFVYYLVDQADTFLRFYIRRSGTPSSNQTIAGLNDESYSYSVKLISDTSNVLFLSTPSGSYNSQVTIVQNTWYCIEIERKTGSGDGFARLWVDGVLKVDRTTENLTGNTHEVDLGSCDYSNFFTGYFDCAVIADAYIGLECKQSQDFMVTGKILLKDEAASLSGFQAMACMQVGDGGGFGYATSPSVEVRGGGATTNATAVANIDTTYHVVTHVNVTSGGIGYTSVPAVYMSDPYGQYQGEKKTAAAMPIMTPDASTGKLKVEQIILSGSIGNPGGWGYDSVPSVTINGAGSGAQAIAEIDPTLRRVTKIHVTNSGQNYTPQTTSVLIGYPSLSSNDGGRLATAFPVIKSGAIEAIYLTGELPSGSSGARFKDSITDKHADLFLMTDYSYYDAPILATNESFYVEKDFTVGGLVASQQGAIMLNYGLSGKPILSTPPTITLMSSERPYPYVPNDTYLPKSTDFTYGLDLGQLYNSGGTKKIYKGKDQYGADLWATGNYSGYYDTLFLFKFDGITPANLDMGNLNVHNINVNHPDAKIQFYSNDCNLYRNVITMNGVTTTVLETDNSFVCNGLNCNAASINGTLGTNGYVYFGAEGFLKSSASLYTSLAQGVYFDSGSGWKYARDIAGGSMLEMHSGNMEFFSAPSGTAGTSATLTEKFAVSSAGQIRVNAIGSSGGLLIGGDTNLYRHAQDVLKTDDNFIVGNATLNINPTSGNPALNLQKNGSTKAQIGVDGSEHLYLQATGSGGLILGASSGTISLAGTIDIGGAADTNLFRDSPNVLKTDDSMIVSQNLWCNSLAVNTNVGIIGNLEAQILPNGNVDTKACLGSYDNYLAYADKQFTVTASQPFTYGNISNLFGSSPEYSGRWTTDNPQIIEIDFPGDVHYWSSVGINFIYYRLATNIKIEYYSSQDSSWHTILDKTNNTSHRIIAPFTSNYVTKLKFTMSGKYEGHSEIAVQKIWGINYNYRGGHWVDKGGDTLYGNYTIEGTVNCGTITSTGNLYLSNNTNGYLWNNGGFIRFSGSNAWNTVNNTGGFVSDGTISATALANTTSIGPLYMNSNHVIGYNQSSGRYKDNISEIIDCSWLYHLRPVHYDWRDMERAKAEGRQMGLIAEEVYAKCPQLVWLDGNGQPEGVHYEWLGIPLIVEMQKLRQEVDELKAKLVAT